MKTKIIFFAVASMFFALSCSKVENFEQGNALLNSQSLSNEAERLPDYDFDQNDTAVHKTILGSGVLPNPYVISNMREAFKNVYGYYPPCDLPVTDIYMKFTPQNEAQLGIMTNSNLDLSTHPLDVPVIATGNYYAPEGATSSTLPTFYTILKSGAPVPEGVPSQVLASMFVPRNSPILEKEAGDILGLTLDDDVAYHQNRSSIINSVRSNPCSDFPRELPCAPCTEAPPPPSKGNVCGYVTMDNNPVLACGDKRPVRQVTIQLKGGFLNMKWDYTMTDDAGKFQSDKNYDKCLVNVIFRNQYSNITNYIDWWQYVWNGMNSMWVHYDKASNPKPNCFKLNIPYVAAPSTGALGNWTAALIHNATIEHREMCAAENVPLPPLDLRIVLHRDKGPHHAGTKMLRKITASNYPLQNADLLSLALNLFGHVPVVNLITAYCSDLYFGYGTPPGTPMDMGFFNTDRFCEEIYHELSHSIHYQLAPSTYIIFGLAELTNNGGQDNDGTPYGPGGTILCPRIAVGEAWAYHMGHYLADLKWGSGCSTTLPEQGDLDDLVPIALFGNSPFGSSHTTFLETFNPNSAIDLNPWIPKGLLNDLMDTRNELTFPVRDLVRPGVFYNQKFAIALAVPTPALSIQDFKNNLLASLAPAVATLVQPSVDNLISDYGW